MELLVGVVLMCALAVAAVVSAFVSGAWVGGVGAAVCWAVAGVQGARLWRRLGDSAESEIHAVTRAKYLLIGAGLFVAGALLLGLVR